MSTEPPTLEPPTAEAPPPEPAHPVQLVVDDDLHRSRLTVFFRLLLAIPHLIWLGLFTVGAFFVGIVNWFATLFSGHSPNGLHDFLAGYIRYATHVFAYLFLAANPYPPFYTASNPRGKVYPVDVSIQPAAVQNRWITGFRIFLAIPALFLSGALSGGGSVANSRGGSSGGVTSVAAFLSWFSALARGRSPRGLRDFIAWGVGYTAQVYAYLFLLTDRYPNSDPLVILSRVETEPPDATGRAPLVNGDDLRRSRLTVFFRLPLAIPHLIWLLLWSLVSLLVGIANWLVTLVRGTPAESLSHFLAAFIRYSTHVNAFLFLVANPFPGFTGVAGSYPVDVRIAPPVRQSRWITGFRIFLAVPAILLNWALSSLLLFVGVFAWFTGLILGRCPVGLQDAGAYTIGYGAQVSCYLFTLTEAYPHSSPLAVLERS
jgi:hypothetical protein